MAATPFRVPISSTAIVASTPKTVALAKAATNQRVKVTGVGLTTDGAVSTNTPLTVEIGRPTAGTGSAAVLKKKDPDNQVTLQTIGTNTFTVEPVWTSLVDFTMFVPQFNGQIYLPIPQTVPDIIVGGGQYAVRITSPNGVDVAGWLDCEE